MPREATSGSFRPGQSGNPKGRPKGARNKATAKREAEISASGLTPLDHMLNVLRDKGQPEERRDAMARAAAPFVHPKLAATVFQDQTETMTHEQRLAELDALGDPPKIINHDAQGNGTIRPQRSNDAGTPAFVPLAAVKQLRETS